MHVNRSNYRKVEDSESNWLKGLFARYWSGSLVDHLWRLDKLVVLTETDKDAWSELDNVVAIPNPSPFIPISVSPLTEKRVIAVARYSYEKGIDLLLRAWAEVENYCDDCRLDVFGDGDRTPYVDQMNQLGIDKTRCQLHGRTDDVEKEYCNSSIFVLSSRFEGFGMVIVEAMACGLPVVAFDCPWGPRSIIQDGEDGLLVENGNWLSLAQGIISMMQDADKLKEMANAAQRNVQRFNMDNIAKHWKQLFEGIINEDL